MTPKDWTSDPRWGKDPATATGTLEDLITLIKRRIQAIGTGTCESPSLYSALFKLGRDRARLGVLWGITHMSDDVDEFYESFDCFEELTKTLVPRMERAKHGDDWSWTDHFEETLEDLDAWDRIYRKNIDDGRDAGYAHPWKLKSSFLTMDTLLGDDGERSSWLIEGAWPENGKVMLSAAAKSGKTTMVGNVCRSLLDGDALLDHFAMKPLAEDESILILDTEMTPDMLHRWFEDQGFTPAARARIRFELLRGKRWDPRDKKAVVKLIDNMTAEKIKVLIIDPLGPIMRRLNLNQDRDADVGPVLAAIEDIMVQAELRGLIVCHHHGHSADRAMGAQAFRAWPDAEWNMTRTADGARFLSMQGRDVDLPETGLKYDKVTRRLSLGEGDRKAHAAVAATGTVLEIVAATPGINTNAIREVLLGRGIKNTAEQTRLITAAKEGTGDAAPVVHTHPGPNRSIMFYVGSCGSECPGNTSDTTVIPRSPGSTQLGGTTTFIGGTTPLPPSGGSEVGSTKAGSTEEIERAS